MKKILKKQNGFTLIELLASITILMIVLMTFMSVFSQSAKHTKMNENDLVAINLARQMLEEVKNKNEVFVQKYTDRTKDLTIKTFDKTEISSTIIKNKDVPSGISEAYPSLKVEVVLSKPKSPVDPTIPLIQAEVRILNTADSKLITNTYGYLKETVATP